MNADPYHVRLSISQYGDRLRAELFTEDLGDTEGEFLPEQWEAVEEWQPYLSQGAAYLPPDAARTLGKELFNSLFGGAENSKKWVEVLEQVKRQKRTLRLLIDASAARARDLPYGLLCEPHDDYFLFRPGGGPNRTPVRAVRILRRCTPRLLNLYRKPLRILIVAAEPVSGDLPTFDCASRLRELVSGLLLDFEVHVMSQDGPRRLDVLAVEGGDAPDSFFEPFCLSRREAVRAALAQHEFDILHVIGHGQDGDLLLCNRARGKVSVSPGELGEWCGTSRLQMAFLQVCEAGSSASRGGFGGLAQQLINPKGGNLAAAIASSYPLEARGSTSAALTFYKGISQGLSPDAALDRTSDEQNWSWAFLELWVRPGALGGVTSRGAFQFVCPYRGLARFEERNFDIFFGREAETAELMHVLEGDSIIAVVGDTGSGKSSLLQAGVASAVRRKGLLGRGGWEIIMAEPGGGLNERLVTALKGEPANAAAGDEGPPADGLLDLLSLKCSGGRSLLLIIDQFEEVFTLKEDEAGLRELCDLLAGFAARHPKDFRLVLGMRSEYLGSAVTIRGVSKAFGHPWVISPPAATDLVKIISEPAKQCEYSFEELDGPGGNLLDRILSDPILTRATETNPKTETTSAVNPLPLLEFALERLWLMSVKDGSHQFRHKDYDQLGGLGGAIVKHAEEIYSILPTVFGPKAQDIARQIFMELVSSSGTRRPRTRQELEVSTGDPDLTRDITNYLVGERLLAIRSYTENLELGYVDLIHEVLIERWDRFQNWLAANPELRALIESFQMDAKKWSKQLYRPRARRQGHLPGYSLAKQYVSWINALKPPLSGEEEQFAGALRKMILRRKGLQALGVLIVIAIVATALFLRREARLNLARKLHERAIVAINDKDMLYAAMYAAKALTLEGGSEEQLKLRDLLLEARAKGATLGASVGVSGKVLDVNFHRGLILSKAPEGNLILSDLREGREIKSFRLDKPDITIALLNNPGNLLAYGTESGEMSVLRADDGNAVYSYRDEANRVKIITTVAFNSAGDRVAFASDTRIKVYDFGSRTLATFSGHEEPVQGVAFSSDGRLLASAGADDTVRLWELATGKQVSYSPFVGHEDLVNTVAFRPGDGQIASEAQDGTIRIWDTGTGKELQVFRKPAPTVGTLTFSPDGRLLAGAGEDEVIRIFDLSTNQELLKIHSQNSEVSKLSFSDSRTLFTGSKSRANLWTVVKNKEVRTLQAENNGPMASVAFSPDGQTLAASSHDSNIYIWDFKNISLKKVIRAAEEGRINSVAYSPDGKLLASGGEQFKKDGSDSPLKLWQVDDDYRQLNWFTGYEFGVPGVAFSPSPAEPLVASAGGHDGKIKVWDYRSRGPVREFSDNTRVFNIAFSPEGRRIASGGYDNYVKLWDLKGGDSPQRYSIQQEGLSGVWGVSFTPDGELLGTGSADKSVVIWSLKDNKEVRRFTEHTGSIFSLEFDPTGAWLASASADSTVRLWDVGNGQSLTLKIHERPVWWVAFSRDGAWLASCGLDKTIRVWDMAEISSFYRASPEKLFEDTKRETGLDISGDNIYVSRP